MYEKIMKYIKKSMKNNIIHKKEWKIIKHIKKFSHFDLVLPRSVVYKRSAIVDWEPGRYVLVEFATFRPDLSLKAFRDKFDDFKTLRGRIYHVKSLSLII